jgi:hypothetical protein
MGVGAEAGEGYIARPGALNEHYLFRGGEFRGCRWEYEGVLGGLRALCVGVGRLAAGRQGPCRSCPALRCGIAQTRCSAGCPSLRTCHCSRYAGHSVTKYQRFGVLHGAALDRAGLPS